MGIRKIEDEIDFIIAKVGDEKQIESVAILEELISLQKRIGGLRKSILK